MRTILVAGSGFSASGPDWVRRHGADHRLPPHELRPGRWLRRERDAGAGGVLAVHCVGSLRPGLEPGRLVVPDDVLDLTGLPYAEPGGPVLHVAFDEPFCPRLRRAFLEAARDWPHGVTDGGVYAETRGPRLESRAEIRFLAGLAEVVGMTAAREASAARELGLCYASLCVVANHATGLGPAADARAIVERTAGWAPEVATLVERAAALAATDAGNCPCAAAPAGAEVSGPSSAESGKRPLNGGASMPSMARTHTGEAT